MNKFSSVNYSYSQAFTLIEVAVTLAITTIGLVGLSAMLIEANRISQDSGNRSQAVWMIEDLTNRIRANRDSVWSYDTGGNPVSCQTPSFSCAAYNTGSKQADVSACSSVQLAQYDLWDVACSRDVSVRFGGTLVDVTRTNAASFIAQPEIIVSVQAGGLTGQEIVTVTVTWDSRTGGLDSSGKRIYISDESLLDTTITTRRESMSSDFTP